MADAVLYDRFAGYYDAIYGAREEIYARESAMLLALFDERSVEVNSLLDVACGTGRHLAALTGRIDDLAGIDASPAMLALARERLPDQVALERADFHDFDLGRRFDVVTCLFSSIGHVADLDALGRVVAAMAAHVSDGGLLVIEPWLTPGMWRDGIRDVQHAEAGDATIVRVGTSRREGELAMIGFGWVVARDGRVEVASEEHAMPLFTPEQYLDAVTAAGLGAAWLEDGLMGRGLLVGARPTRPREAADA